jgi:predicted nucleotidyltransferase
MKLEITNKMKNEIRRLTEKNGLDLVVLFGSQATGKTHSKSDVDIAILARKELDTISLMGEFSRIFHREDVEVVDLSLSSPTMMQAVARDAKILYEKEADIFIKWKSYAWKIWMETAWLRHRRDEKIKKWAEKIQCQFAK